VSRLTFVTRNKGKFQEALGVLGPLGYDLVQDARGYPELQAETLEEVARAGVEHLRAAGGPAPPFFLEDAGLFVDALGGFPGVYSAYVYKTIGNQGLLRLLEGRPRTARFEAVLAYHDGESTRLFRGACPGRIVEQERGTGGFGFDPIFVPEGEGRTFGEMDLAEKERVSHRARALDALAAALRPRT